MGSHILNSRHESGDYHYFPSRNIVVVFAYMKSYFEPMSGKQRLTLFRATKHCEKRAVPSHQVNEARMVDEVIFIAETGFRARVIDPVECRRFLDFPLGACQTN